jgi:ATP-binding cassette subfamily B (MDR/TAP) protein 1
MVNGAVIEQGTHDGLLNIEGGHYRNLVQAQSLRDDDPQNKKGLMVPSEDMTLGLTPSASARPSAEISKERISDAHAAPDPKHTVPDGFFKLFARILALNKDCLNLYILGGIASILSGCHYPAYGILYSQAITNFQFDPNSEASKDLFKRRANRTSMWLAVVALLVGLVNATQQATLLSAATNFAGKLRKMSFRALLKHDGGQLPVEDFANY